MDTVRDASSFHGFLTHNVRSGIITCDPQIACLIGRDGTGEPVTLDQFDYLSRVAPDDRSAFLRAYSAAVALAAPLRVSYSLLDTEGRRRHVHFEGSWQLGSDGRPETLVGVLHGMGEGEIGLAARFDEDAALALAEHVMTLGRELFELADRTDDERLLNLAQLVMIVAAENAGRALNRSSMQ